jgi:hypothetical protein
MENANKALIIAGGTILGIMILSLLVYLFRAGGKVSQSIDDKQIYHNTQLFNQQFENYAGEDKENNISDVITLINLAVDANKDAGYNDRKSVSVNVRLDSTHILSIPGIIPINRNYAFQGEADTLEQSYRANNSVSLTKINLLELRNKPVKDMGLHLTGLTSQSDVETLGEAYRDPDTNKIIYKYLFVVPEDGIEYYHAATRGSEEKSYDGRVNKITIELRVNPDFPTGSIWPEHMLL